MKLVLAFLGGVGFQEIIFLLFFFLLIPIALRSFFLWYWKVNVIIDNQQKQIDLLMQLVKQNDGQTKAPGDKVITTQ